MSRCYNEEVKQMGIGTIEMLFVVSVVVLTVFGLFIGLDPFEQTKNIRDTNLKKTITTIKTELDNYRKKYGVYPWDNPEVNSDSDKCGALSGNSKRSYSLVGISLSDPQMMNCLEVLQENLTLKSDFMKSLSKDTLSSVFVTSNTTSTVSLCFLPKGKSMWLDAKTIFDQDGNNLDNKDEDNLDQCEPGWKLIKRTTEMGKSCHVCVN